MNAERNLINAFEDELSLADLEANRGQVLFQRNSLSYSISSQANLSDFFPSSIFNKNLILNNFNSSEETSSIAAIAVEVFALDNALSIDAVVPSFLAGEVSNKGKTLPVSIYTLNGLAPNPNLETWVVIHGFVSSPTVNTIGSLADTIANENGGNKQVILLDWSAPADQFLPELAAQWIRDVAGFAVSALQTGWGIAANNINLIGHSLGAYVSSEIGNLYGSNINHLIALDPALNGVILDDVIRLGADPNDEFTNNKDDVLNLLFQTARIFSDRDTYDVDGDTEGIQAPVEFNPVSNFSRAFWGDILKGNGLGSARYARSADESFELLFEQSASNADHHGDIVLNYANVILERGLGEISRRINLDAPSNSNEWKISPQDEGIMAIRSSGIVDEFGNDPGTIPSLLAVKNTLGTSDNDEIVYGSLTADLIVGTDLDSQGSALFNSIGNDTLYGDRGEDTIADNLGNDIAIGGNDNDNLSTGEGNDTLFGVDPNVANPGIGEIDALTGGSGGDLLVLGDETQVYYNSGIDFNSGLNDYALITDFNLTEDKIQLFGNKNLYELGTSSATLPEGTAIFYKNLEVNELIGIVGGVMDLSLDEDYFVFV